MRNLNECQAEVFRRSEKRIKERRQRRNHILMACIPPVLCIVILGAFLFPNVTTDGAIEPGDMRPPADGMEIDQESSLTGPIAKVTVAGADLFLTYTDASDILLISSQLYSYGTRAPSAEVAPGDGTAEAREDNKDLEPNVYDSVTDSANIGFTITLVLREGEKTEFYLTGNTLKNLTTKQKYTLSQKEGNELKDLLGIPRS